MSRPSPMQHLTDPRTNFDAWYVDVVQQAELADDAPVRGMKVVRPYGYGIWELVQRALDDRFKATGVENAYFPLLIPQSMMEREAEHIEGFTPEVAWVTRGGTKELDEPLAIRPSSEAIVCPIVAGWVQSWRDLPVLLNQWGSVVRWEDRPRAFLRTSEFLWQEGHTCHATDAEADQRARQMLDVYRDVYESELAIPVIAGVKSESEKFAGAFRTYTLEAMMGGKNWALQGCTSHNLADHFSRSFGIQFLDRDGERRYAQGTSWGLSHRVIGAVVMVHGDERGLKVPPRIAPIQAIIVPILGRGGGTAVLEAAHRLRDQLAGTIRVRVDDRDDRTPGFKFNHWELRGVPIRIELGPRDLAANQVMVVERDTGAKTAVPLDQLADDLPRRLEAIQGRLLEAARERLAALTIDVDDWEILAGRVATNAGWNRAWWCGAAACEERVKTETKATIRCIPFDQPDLDRRAALLSDPEEAAQPTTKGSRRITPPACIACGQPSTQRVIMARAY